MLLELESKSRNISGRLNYSIHKLSTDSETWASVEKRDSFFEGVEVYTVVDDFLEVIVADKTISALDVAKLLLTMQPMSNLKLQKMLYLVYAEFLFRFEKPLFSEKIIAYQYGPVVTEVYERYKKYGRDVIAVDDEIVVLDEITTPMAMARILQSDDGTKILRVVKQTLSKFGAKNASELVEITHRPGSPWSSVEERRGEITDELILAHHQIERA